MAAQVRASSKFGSPMSPVSSCFRFVAIINALLILLTFAPFASADLIVDSAASTTTVTIAGVSDTSSTSGTARLFTTPTDSPFATAQIRDLDVVLDDALNFSLLFGTVNIASNAGEIQVQMVAPGNPGNVAAGSFDQLENTLAASGTFTQTGVLGNDELDLSSLGELLVDFNAVQISSVGEIVTIEATYEITDEVNGFEVSISGRIVASGVVSIPEPVSGTLIGLVLLAGCTRRTRR